MNSFANIVCIVVFLLSLVGIFLLCLVAVYGMLEVSKKQNLKTLPKAKSQRKKQNKTKV